MTTGEKEKLKGKLALVTGAARVIGRSHALRLAHLGADIVINDIDLGDYITGQCVSACGGAIKF